MAANEYRIAIGRSNGDITVLHVSQIDSSWSVEKNIIGDHTSSINFVRLTSDGWHLLSGAGDGVVRLWSRVDSWTTPFNVTLNGFSGDWNDLNKQFTVG
jgi:WD40 repeat protein